MPHPIPRARHRQPGHPRQSSLRHLAAALLIAFQLGLGVPGRAETTSPNSGDQAPGTSPDSGDQAPADQAPGTSSEGTSPEARPKVGQLLSDALQRPPERILVRRRSAIVPVSVEEIDWIEASGDYVSVRCGREKYLVERTLGEMERLLAPKSFERIHRSAMVNVSKIRDLRPLGSGRYRLILLDGTELVLSRKYWPRFRAQLL